MRAQITEAACRHQREGRRLISTSDALLVVQRQRAIAALHKDNEGLHDVPGGGMRLEEKLVMTLNDRP